MTGTAFKGRWLLVAVPAAVIAAYAIAVLSIPSFGPPFIQQRLATIPLAVVGHLLSGAVALLIGAFQVNTGLRKRFLNLHRWMGRTYVIAVLLGGSSALVLATQSQGGLVTHVGFGLLAVLWMVATGIAYRHIRRRDEINHRRWMLRSYALTFAAVTLRFWLPASLAAGLPFLDAYQVIAWAC